ncbi:MAG: glutamine--fructose-6-phosphate transaminase (isomerizing), partial [Nitrospinota bacterium]|nr:glutamine--fructose-6-phosphate transaminase (isomerizing) [Nitrospinota bacterium]
GIAHTRWATHGAVTKENSHPHSSCGKDFSITHNGIISNHQALREKLERDGHRFLSETDTEVIVHLVESYFTKTRSVEKSFVSAIRELEGTYAVAMITSHEPDKIFAVRRESPLIIGLGSDANYVASDFNAFVGHTKSAVFIEDGEYAMVAHDSYCIKSLATGETIPREVQELPWDSEMAQKGGFPHYMLKEIYEQPTVVHTALDIDNAKIEALARAVAGRNLTLTGVGTTFYVAQFAQYLFNRYAGISPLAVSSDEFKYLAQLTPESLVLAVSQSGETYDTLSALRHAKSRGSATAAIVNVMGSTMARTVDNLILQASGPEICVLSTKAAMAQMIILARLALETGVVRGAITRKEANARLADLRLIPEAIENTLNEKSGFIHTIAKAQCHINHWLFLGRERYYPVARESALKMKEVSYVHAEGMPSGFLKHGTIALIDEKMNSVVFMPGKEEKELYDLSLSSVEEINARGGYTLGIMMEEKGKRPAPFSDIISLPRTPSFAAPFMQMVAAQLLAYFTAVTLKRNVDRPRSLAKSVTVS